MLRRLRPNHKFFIALTLLTCTFTGSTPAVATQKPATQKQAVIPHANGPLMIEGLRFGGAGEKNRIVIDFNSAPDFRAFLLDNPLRLAVDLPAAEWRTARNSLAGQSLISGYRSGILEKTGLIRIIFDLRKPAIVSGAFVLPRGSMSKDRVVIDLLPSSRNLFAARRADIYGNKNLKNTVQTYTLLPPASETAAIRNRDMEKIPLPTAKPTAATSKEKDHVYTVVIDAGHGGDDPGAISSGLQEKNITLSVAKELQRQLQEKGRYKVVMTRDHDYYIKLRDRLAISRRVMGDLFVSIHADKVARQGIRGASIYTLSENASDNETARLADDENNAGVVAGVDLKEESQDVAGILLDLAMREKMNESNVLASAVVEAFRRKSVQLLPNSHRSAGFAVLKAPDVPAILIETGFISNQNEAKLLSSAAFQRKIASAITDGIGAYFQRMQSLHRAQ